MEIRNHLMHEGIAMGALLAGAIGCFVSLGILEKKLKTDMQKAPEIEAIVEKTEVFPEEHYFDKYTKRPSPNNFVNCRGAYAGYPLRAIFSVRNSASVYLTVKLPDGSRRIFEYWNNGPDSRSSIVNRIVSGYKQGEKATFKDGFTIPPIPELSKE